MRLLGRLLGLIVLGGIAYCVLSLIVPDHYLRDEVGFFPDEEKHKINRILDKYYKKTDTYLFLLTVSDISSDVVHQSLQNWEGFFSEQDEKYCLVLDTEDEALYLLNLTKGQAIDPNISEVLFETHISTIVNWGSPAEISGAVQMYANGLIEAQENTKISLMGMLFQVVLAGLIVKFLWSDKISGPVKTCYGVLVVGVGGTIEILEAAGTCFGRLFPFVPRSSERNCSGRSGRNRNFTAGFGGATGGRFGTGCF